MKSGRRRGSGEVLFSGRVFFQRWDGSCRCCQGNSCFRDCCVIVANPEPPVSGVFRLQTPQDEAHRSPCGRSFAKQKNWTPNFELELQAASQELSDMPKASEARKVPDPGDAVAAEQEEPSKLSATLEAERRV